MLRRHIVLVIAVITFITPLASAQPLIDRVPGDAFLYIGWRGTDALGLAYEQSHLAAIIKASNLKAIPEQMIPQLLQQLPQDNPEEAAVVQAIVPLLKHAWKRPTAIFMTAATDSRGEFEPRLGIIVDAGEVAADFEKSLAGVIEQASTAGGKSSTPVKSDRDGNLVFFTVGFADGLKKPDQPLAQQVSFVTAMKQVDPEPVYAMFVNVQKLVRSIDDSIARGNDKEMREQWPKVRDSLGLSGLRRFAMTGAFDGKDWSSRAYLEAPAPRQGLMALLDNKPIRESSLKLIPKSAAYATIRQFDPAKLLAQIRDAFGAAGPGAAANFDAGMAAAAKAIGINIADIVEPLGDQWVIYHDKGVGGVGGAGLILVNELDDPAKATESFNTLNATAARLLAGNPQMAQMIRPGTRDFNGLKVNTFQAPQATIAWAIHDGKLYLGLMPEAVAAATVVSNNTGGTFDQNETFKQLQAKLGVKDIDGFEYADLAQSAPQKHTEIQQALMMMSMVTASKGVLIPPNLLPPIDVLQQHLAPAASASWVDDAGWHQRATSPFPGSRTFASQQGDYMTVGGSALAVSILLPSLNRARETANRVKCASNMRQIGQGALLYSNDNKGKYPDTLGEILKTQDITLEVFECPSGDVTAPADVAKGTMEAKVAWVDKGCPYTWVGKGLKNSTPGDVLVLYEREDDHGGDGMNMLFADGHVEWNSMAVAKEIIRTGKAVEQPAQRSPNLRPRPGPR